MSDELIDDRQQCVAEEPASEREPTPLELLRLYWSGDTEAWLAAVERCKP